MNWFIKMLNSSLGQKVLMSLTGLFLCSFLVVHVAGNVQLFKDDQGLAFNKYTAFMTTNPLIKTISYVLYAIILFHAFKGLLMAGKNQKARPVKYAVNGGKFNSHWTSRNMGVLGTVVLIFLVVHMKNFWAEYKFGYIPYKVYVTNLADGTLQEVMEQPKEFKLESKMEEQIVGNVKYTVVKDLYKTVELGFKEWWLVALYVVAMFALAFHLYHGFKSAFQSLGLNHKKYNGLIQFVGVWLFAIAIPAAFAAMPVFFFFK